MDVTYQLQGIGREPIRRTHEAAGLVLLAAPAARGYYPHIGMTRHDLCRYVPQSSTEPYYPWAAGHAQKASSYFAAVCRSANCNAAELMQ
jgi:hypothetical protein